MFPSAQIPRAPRFPLYVPVLTVPAIPDCWSIDLSRKGIGLMVGREDDGLPEEGDPIELDFPLPGAGSRVHARGRVRWRHASSGPAGLGGGTGIGVEFEEMEPEDREALDRYLQDHRFRVGVAFATGEERVALEAAVGDATHLHFADSVAGLRDLVSRGDVAAVVVCGGDDTLLESAADALMNLRVALFGHNRVPADLAPRLVHLGEVSDRLQLRLFNEGRLFRALCAPADPTTLRHTVLDACAEFGIRTEQRRAVHALERTLQRQRALDRPVPKTEAVVQGRLVFRSAGMAEVLELVRTVAPHPISVLLQGETGTGKEILARILHDLSDRSNAPFVVQDCGALPETLLESELFGHVRGAFTGAVGDHPGLFVTADGGTIFLDEIENTTPELQAKLLRVLETGSIRPVGGRRPRTVDVRVVAAGNRNLEAEVRAGRFRADLYYRLAAFVVDVPPLRDRPDDVPVLARHYLRRARASIQRSVRGVSEAAEAALAAYAWPGNVRELKNAVERAVLLCPEGGTVQPHHLPPRVAAASSGRRRRAGTLRDRVEAAEREAIEEALARHRGVLRRAAPELGVSAVTLGRKARRLGILLPQEEVA